MPKYAGCIWGTVFRKYILRHLPWFWEGSLICMLQEGILYFCDLLDLLFFSSSVCGKASSWQNFLPWKGEFRMKNRVSLKELKIFLCVCMLEISEKRQFIIYYFYDVVILVFSLSTKWPLCLSLNKYTSFFPSKMKYKLRKGLCRWFNIAYYPVYRW